MMIFLHLPKTGGTSFRFILENSFGVSHCHTNQTQQEVFTQKQLDFARKFFPRLKCVAGHNLIDPLNLTAPDPFFMTMLREPIARVISHYQDGVLRRKNQETFEQALARNEELENLQVKLMAGDRNLDKAKRFLEKCSFVGLTEKFDLSLHALKQLSPYPLNLNYKRKVVARDNAVKKSLESNEQMLALARDRNQLDLALYQFAVNEIFPKMCAQAGLTATDQVPSYNNYTSENQIRYRVGRFYNKIFRQICKIAL